jgi:hypothetical protein
MSAPATAAARWCWSGERVDGDDDEVRHVRDIAPKLIWLTLLKEDCIPLLASVYLAAGSCLLIRFESPHDLLHLPSHAAF